MKLESDIGPLRAAWNSTQLRLGDHVHLEQGKNAPRVQPRKWDVHGALKLGFTLTQASLLPSCRYVDARACAAHCHLALQSQGAQAHAQASTATGWVFIERCFGGAAKGEVEGEIEGEVKGGIEDEGEDEHQGKA